MGSCNGEKDIIEALFTKCGVIEIVNWYGLRSHVQVCYLEPVIRKHCQTEQMGILLETQVIHYLVKSQIRNWIHFLQYSLTKNALCYLI